MNKSWKRACLAKNFRPCRPYDLRHSFATAALEATGDVAAVAGLLMHSEKSQMMGRYTLGSVPVRHNNAVAKFSALIGLKGAQKSGAVQIRLAPRLAPTGQKSKKRKKTA
jgi:integrase